MHQSYMYSCYDKKLNKLVYNEKQENSSISLRENPHFGIGQNNCYDLPI